jgi:hypothetical protein
LWHGITTAMLGPRPTVESDLIVSLLLPVKNVCDMIG